MIIYRWISFIFGPIHSFKTFHHAKSRLSFYSESKWYIFCNTNSKIYGVKEYIPKQVEIGSEVKVNHGKIYNTTQCILIFSKCNR